MDDQRIDREGDSVEDEKAFARGCLTTITLVCAAGVVLPILVFIATHNMHPADARGEFGEGFKNLIDLLLYGIVAVPAAIGLVICSVLWAIEWLYGEVKKQ